MPGMQLTRLRLKDWRNFRSVDCPLTPRTFIVGPNASGKSNLLDALRFLRDVASEGGGLQAAVSRREGFKAIRSLFTHGPKSHVSLQVDATIGANRWTYELEIEDDRRGGAQVREERVQKNGSEVLRRHGKDETREEKRRQTALEQSALNESFEELVHGLRGIRYAHLVPQMLRTTKLHGDRELASFGSTFLQRVYETPAKQRKPRLALINRALKGLLPFFEDLQTAKDDLGNPHLHIRLKHWRTTTAVQDESSLSDGTLRLIGLLWEILDGDAPLLLEEPELSLHESAVRELPALIASVADRRQVILTTHALSMFEARGIGPNEILLVRASHGRSASESVVEHGGTNVQLRRAIEHEMLLSPILEVETKPPNPHQLTIPGLAPESR